VAPGIGHEDLLEIVDRLREEAGGSRVAIDGRGDPSLAAGQEVAFSLTTQDEVLVAKMRERFAGLAAAVADDSDPGIEGAVGRTLDVIELVMRGELTRGNAELIPDLMPSFVFLVATTAADRDRALALSRRAEELIASKGLGER
jgi:hypothetical protein